MTNKEFCLSKRVFMKCCIGTIVEMSPANKPRKLEIIVDKLNTYFRENTKQKTTFNIDYPILTDEEIQNLVYGITKIPEVEELNLSENEFKKGIKVSDNRLQFHFIDSYTEENGENDFIDLSALTRNIYNAISKEALEIIKENLYDCNEYFNHEDEENNEIAIAQIEEDLEDMK